MMKRVRIIATIGPASADERTLRRLIGEGMDVARLNLSHGSHAEHAAAVKRIRELSAKAGRHVAVLADLGGPKIRTGRLPGGAPMPLSRGQAVALAPEGRAAGGEIPFSFGELASDLKPGSILLVDDGAISLRVTSVGERKIEAKVLCGGLLRDHKGINLPGIVLSAGAVTKRDEADLRFAISAGADIIGLSFVQDAGDVARARSIMRRAKADLPIVAKIERRVAVDNLEEIVAAADAAMVARGDLGVEMPLEQVPVVQKEVIAACAGRRKPVIVATQMLESMVRNSRPTRAEATDVSNAVFEGADAVMLSAETSIGDDPVNALKTMARIADAAESSAYIHRRAYVPDELDRSVELAVARAACFAAEESRARAICVFTQSGACARMVSAQRPGVAIAAATEREESARRARLYWGVEPLVTGKWRSIESMLREGIAALKAARMASGGDTVVTVAGSTPFEGATDAIKVLKI